MTVSTEYFDYVFENRSVVTDDLSKAIKKLGKLERKQARTQSLVDDRATNKRLSRLAERTALVDAKQDEIDELIGRLNTLEAVELPKDEVTYSLWSPTDGLTGLEVTVTDSPYDDTFVGGQQSNLFVRGSGKLTDGGSASFGTDYGFIPETFEDATDTFSIATSSLDSRLDGSYSDVTATLQGAVTTIIADGAVVI